MVEAIRQRPGAPGNLANHIIGELERYARKQRVRTLTFLVPMDNNRALAQVKSWGFEEFRIMPEGARLLAFFRKRIA
jgi:ribosomal protein S18 acetylase RimI-like enzyme